MAVMESLLPPTLGGKPDLAKKHFERAIEISAGTNLMAKVLYAEKYARKQKLGIWGDPALTKRYLRLKSKWGQHRSQTDK